MLVKIVHVKYCPANWQTALQQHRFSTFGGVTPPHPPPPNSYAPVFYVHQRSLKPINHIASLLEQYNSTYIQHIL